MSPRTAASRLGRALPALPFLLLLGAGAPPAPAPAPLPELIGRIDAAQREVKTLQADFVQRNRVKLFKQELTSKGRLLYQRGPSSQLRWEYTAPDPSTMLLLGQKAYLQMPGRPAQVFDTAKDSTLRAIFTELELWLGNGSLAAAKDEYDMSRVGAATVVLVPKARSALSKTFARVEMRLDERTLLLSSLLLVEKGGDEKEIQFARVQRNAPLPPDAFKP